MAQALERLDPSMLKAEELEQLQAMLNDQPCLVGREEFRLPLPAPIFHLLLRVVSAMRKGQSVLLMPESEAFTTQAAANFLGVSRPFLIELLENGDIPFYTVGSHRRVKLVDLQSYSKKRDGERNRRLNDLFDKIAEAGKYE